MNDRSQQLRQPIRIEDLLEGLERILQQTESITNRSVGAAQWTQIADYLTQIRVLLAALTKLPRRPEESSDPGEKLKDLFARYFRLEGRIKEIRNDRHAPLNGISIRTKAKKRGLG